MRKGFSPLVIVLIVGIIAVVIGGVYFMRNRGTMTPSSVQNTPESKSETKKNVPDNFSESSTIESVIGRGQSLECDWIIPVASGENPFGTGKLWTTGNLGRSTITGNVSGMSMEGNAVYKNNEVYSWMTLPSGKMGFKFTESELKEMDSSMTPQERQQAEQIRSEMMFNCHPWIPDNSKFELPPDVEFKSS